MKLALVNAGGTADVSTGVYEALAAHDVVRVYGEALTNMAGVPTLPIQQWEALLHETEVDAVFVIAPGHMVGELPKIVQSALPLILLHPAASMLECFALQMVQRESNSLIYPCVTEHDEAAITMIRQWIEDAQSPIGVIQQLEIERPLANRNRESIETAFAIDAFLLRRLLGNIVKLSAVGADPLQSDPPDSWARLRVQMVAHGGQALSWSSVAVGAAQQAKLTLVGEMGSAEVMLVDYPHCWQVGVDGVDRPMSAATRPNPLDSVATSIQLNDAMPKIWDDACRGLELADSIEYSLRRGKTVEMFETEVTEAGTFRGIMATAGCLILLASLAFTLAVAAIESVWSIGGPFRYLPWVILALGLGVFLTLQLLNLALPKSNRGSGQPDS